MKVTIEYHDGVDDIVSKITPTAEAVAFQAKKFGYQEKVPDPVANRALELKHAEFLALDPDDAQREVLGRELGQLQIAASVLVPNPTPAGAFIVSRLLESLIGGQIDEATLQVEAQALLNTRLAEEKVAAKVRLQITRTKQAS